MIRNDFIILHIKAIFQTWLIFYRHNRWVDNYNVSDHFVDINKMVSFRFEEK